MTILGYIGYGLLLGAFLKALAALPVVVARDLSPQAEGGSGIVVAYLLVALSGALVGFLFGRFGWPAIVAAVWQ